MAAAAKAKELMDRYQVDLSETELEDEGFAKGATEFPERRKLNVQDLIGWDIARYCEVKAWKTRGEPPYFEHGAGASSTLAFALTSSSPIGS